MGGGQFRGGSSVEMLACLSEFGLGSNNYAEANGSRRLQIVSVGSTHWHLREAVGTNSCSILAQAAGTLAMVEDLQTVTVIQGNRGQRQWCTSAQRDISKALCGL